MFQKLCWLAFAGALGSLARYGLAGIVHRISGATLPWGTMVVNIAGCFFAGFVWMLFESRWPVTGETRTIILVGFFGAFTTFSAMILESSELLRSAEWFYALGNIVSQTGFGFVALTAGASLGRVI